MKNTAQYRQSKSNVSQMLPSMGDLSRGLPKRKTRRGSRYSCASEDHGSALGALGINENAVGRARIAGVKEEGMKQTGGTRLKRTSAPRAKNKETQDAHSIRDSR